MLLYNCKREREFPSRKGEKKMTNTANTIMWALKAQGITVAMISEDDKTNFPFTNRTFIYVDKKDREKTEMVLDTLLKRIKKVPSWTEYKSNTRCVILKED